MRTLVKCLYTGDRKLFHMINAGIKCRLLDRTMPYLTKLGGAMFTIGLTFAMMVMGNGNLKSIGMQAWVSLTVSHLAVQIVKRLVTRIRPYELLEHINTFNITLKDYSFPSGHTTASFSIATIIALNVSVLVYPIILLGMMIGVSRIYLGVHYPSDVLVGGALGAATSILTQPYVINFLG